MTNQCSIHTRDRGWDYMCVRIPNRAPECDVINWHCHTRHLGMSLSWQTETIWLREKYPYAKEHWHSCAYIIQLAGNPPDKQAATSIQRSSCPCLSTASCWWQWEGHTHSLTSTSVGLGVGGREGLEMERSFLRLQAAGAELGLPPLIMYLRSMYMHHIHKLLSHNVNHVLQHLIVLG